MRGWILVAFLSGFWLQCLMAERFQYDSLDRVLDRNLLSGSDDGDDIFEGGNEEGVVYQTVRISILVPLGTIFPPMSLPSSFEHPLSLSIALSQLLAQSNLVAWHGISLHCLRFRGERRNSRSETFTTWIVFLLLALC
jgi:hypothetical protein